MNSVLEMGRAPTVEKAHFTHVPGDPSLDLGRDSHTARNLRVYRRRVNWAARKLGGAPRVWSICLRVASGEVAGRGDVVGLRRLAPGAWCEARRDCARFSFRGRSAGNSCGYCVITWPARVDAGVHRVKRVTPSGYSGGADLTHRNMDRVAYLKPGVGRALSAAGPFRVHVASATTRRVAKVT